MDRFRGDIMLALRRMRSAPAFTLFAVVTLALGLGATTGIYSVIYSAVLRPPAIPDVERVVNLYHADPIRLGGLSGSLRAFSTPDFEDLRRLQTSFSAVAAWTRFREMLIANRSGALVLGEMVGGEYFQALGVPAAYGRTIQPADDRPGAPLVIVLSESLWRHRFGADPAVIGRTVRLGTGIFEVIGVTAASFRGVDMPNVTPTAAWVPLSASDTLRPGFDRTDREARWLFARARLKPGVTVAQAAAEVAAIGSSLDRAHPIGRGSDRRQMRPYIARDWAVLPTTSIYLHESVHRVAAPMAWAAMAAVVLVLLVACTNLANLLLARGAARRHEIGVRVALGASRRRLLGELLVESTLVAVAGALGGVIVTRGLLTGLSGEIRVGNGLNIQFSPVLHPSVLALAAGATLLALVVFGLLPAIHVTRADVRGLLASDNAGSASPRWRTRRYLIGAQVAVSVLLVALAALCVQQVMTAALHDPGFDLDRIAVASVDFGLQGYDEPRARQIVEATLDALRRAPDVEVAGISSGLPVGTGTPGALLARPGVPFMPRSQDIASVELLAATPSIFQALGVAIQRGRALDERDTAGSAPVAVIDAATARDLFGPADAVGREIVVRRRRWAGEADRRDTARLVVGVTAVTDVGVVGERRRGVIYIPWSQHFEPRIAVVARAAAEPAAAVETVRTALNRVDPELGVIDSGTGIAMGGASNLVLKVMATLTGMLGMLALLLAMVGLYGVLSHLVAGRTREVGIRMALGASASRVRRMIVRDGLRPVAAGIIIGLGAGALARMALRPVFVRLLPALDSTVLLVVPVLFLAAGAAACYLPARRAARVDPNVALRHL